MDHPDLTVSNFMESSIGLKRVMDMQLDYITANDMEVDK